MKERQRHGSRALVFAGLMAAAGLATLGLLPNRAATSDLPADGVGAASAGQGSGRYLDEAFGNHEEASIRDADREDAEADGSSEPSVRPQRKKGIPPPWREHAIPELRDRPERRSRQLNA